MNKPLTRAAQIRNILKFGNNVSVETGKVFNTGSGMNFAEFTVEPCNRLVEIGKGLPHTCTCTACRYRKASPAERLEIEAAVIAQSN